MTRLIARSATVLVVLLVVGCDDAGQEVSAPPSAVLEAESAQAPVAPPAVIRPVPTVEETLALPAALPAPERVALTVVNVGQACTPQCGGKQCGPDGCGGACGSCTNYLGKPYCDTSGQCVAQNPCVRDCTNKTCGDDGCGGQCGQCGVGQGCVLDHCAALEPALSCQARCGQVAPGGCSCRAGCDEDPSGFGCCEDVAAACACIPSCAGKQCGSDGCGGSCGTCASGSDCEAGQCVDDPCDPDPCHGHGRCDAGVCTCDAGFGGATCDVCGPGLVAYPTCRPDPCQYQTCSGRGTCDPATGACTCAGPWTGSSCETCVPQCTNKTCGSDGCGGECGACISGTCNASQRCDCAPGTSGDHCELCTVEVAPGFDINPRIHHVAASAPRPMVDAFDGSTLDTTLWRLDTSDNVAATVAGGALRIARTSAGDPGGSAWLSPRSNTFGDQATFTGDLVTETQLTWGTAPFTSLRFSVWEPRGSESLDVLVSLGPEPSVGRLYVNGQPAPSTFTMPASLRWRIEFSPSSGNVEAKVLDLAGTELVAMAPVVGSFSAPYTFTLDVQADAPASAPIVDIESFTADKDFVDPAHWRVTGSAFVRDGVAYDILAGDDAPPPKGFHYLPTTTDEIDGFLEDGGPLEGFDGTATTINAGLLTAVVGGVTLRLTMLTARAQAGLQTWVADSLAGDPNLTTLTIDHFFQAFTRRPSGDYTFVPPCPSP